MKIYLTRHGQTEWNVQQRMQGQNNSPLTELGEWQATQLGNYWYDVQFDCIYSSSSPRALHTAELVRGKRNIPITACDDLREISLGEWEGMTFGEAEKQYPEQFYNFWHKPEIYFRQNSESFEELRRRTSGAIERIVQQHCEETVLVVTHGMVLRTLYTYFQKQSISEIAHSPHIHSACVCLVENNGDFWNVLRWNEEVNS
ncbi:MAG: histidine phosphatase family protein [Bacteroidales bacterium]|jgi:probable phosphoglycerate mutase|nr:histidine phosphatase family protein [Bacteroidales bacterium]